MLLSRHRHRLVSVAAQFCTIDPTEARVEVPDPRFKNLVEKWTPKSEVPAYLQVRHPCP